METAQNTRVRALIMSEKYEKAAYPPPKPIPRKPETGVLAAPKIIQAPNACALPPPPLIWIKARELKEKLSLFKRQTTDAHLELTQGYTTAGQQIVDRQILALQALSYNHSLLTRDFFIPPPPGFQISPLPCLDFLNGTKF